ncbi:MAG: DeoR/GlpR transcriptional regulator, partial [Clostridia bacterium]|nr:DeoR/GlpR transcriptional regulator [Clostridia bacterium]
MSQKRIDVILGIIKEQGYVTVKYLCDTLNYSTATINRDLNDLQKQKLIVRHYGGAELVKRKGVPLAFRYHKMRPAKRMIAKEAAKLIKDGMTVFIDGTTTTHYIGDYIKNIKNLTVITNNLNLASHLSESGVRCICLGGQIVEIPYMIGGADAVRQVHTYTADLAFFSTGGISSSGKIYADLYFDLIKAMIENSHKSVLLIDHQKLDCECQRVIGDLSDIDV